MGEPGVKLPCVEECSPLKLSLEPFLILDSVFHFRILPSIVGLIWGENIKSLEYKIDNIFTD